MTQKRTISQDRLYRLTRYDEWQDLLQYLEANDQACLDQLRKPSIDGPQDPVSQIRANEQFRNLVRAALPPGVVDQDPFTLH